MKQDFNVWIKDLLFLFAVAALSCSKKYLGYLPNEDVKSKYGFKIYMNDGFQGDTVSLFVNGVELFRNEVFELPTDTTRWWSSKRTEITLNEGTLVGVVEGRKFGSTFSEQRHILLEVYKGKLKTTFNVDLKKGQFLYIHDFSFYGDLNPKKHIIGFRSGKRVPKNKAIDYSVHREMVRLLQCPSPIAVM